MQADAYVEFTRRFFGRWSRWYDLYALPIGFAYAAAVRRARPAAGRRILDVCSGTGEVARRCARRGADVVAIDLTPSMLDRARRKTRDLPIEFAMMDARHLAFPDRSFDMAFLSFALHDMPRRVRCEALHEAARVAREGVVVLDYEVPRHEPWRGSVLRFLGLFETPFLAGFARRGVEGALADAGLCTVEMTRPLPGFFAVRVARPI
jgi:ubiquinone/menaquinone biosynthesis C-methylase UbiE